MSSSSAPILPRASDYRGVRQAIYDAMDQQAADQKKDPALLDRLHELQQVGAPWQAEQRVESIAGVNLGKSGAITSLGLGSNYVLYDDGTSESLGYESTQRDWLALASI